MDNLDKNLEDKLEKNLQQSDLSRKFLSILGNRELRIWEQGGRGGKRGEEGMYTLSAAVYISNHTAVEDKLDRYRGFIQEILDRYGSVKPANGEISFSELSQLKPPEKFFSGTYADRQDETREHPIFAFESEISVLRRRASPRRLCPENPKMSPTNSVRPPTAIAKGRGGHSNAVSLRVGFLYDRNRTVKILIQN